MSDRVVEARGGVVQTLPFFFCLVFLLFYSRQVYPLARRSHVIYIFLPSLLVEMLLSFLNLLEIRGIMLLSMILSVFKDLITFLLLATGTLLFY